MKVIIQPNYVIMDTNTPLNMLSIYTILKKIESINFNFSDNITPHMPEDTKKYFFVI